MHRTLLGADELEYFRWFLKDKVGDVLLITERQVTYHVDCANGKKCDRHWTLNQLRYVIESHLDLKQTESKRHNALRSFVHGKLLSKKTCVHIIEWLLFLAANARHKVGLSIYGRALQVDIGLGFAIALFDSVARYPNEQRTLFPKLDLHLRKEIVRLEETAIQSEEIVVKYDQIYIQFLTDLIRRAIQHNTYEPFIRDRDILLLHGAIITLLQEIRKLFQKSIFSDGDELNTFLQSIHSTFTRTQKELVKEPLYYRLLIQLQNVCVVLEYLAQKAKSEQGTTSYFIYFSSTQQTEFFRIFLIELSRGKIEALSFHTRKESDCIALPDFQFPMIHLVPVLIDQLLHDRSDQDLVQSLRDASRVNYDHIVGSNLHRDQWINRLSVLPQEWEDNDYSLPFHAFSQQIPVGVVWHVSRSVLLASTTVRVEVDGFPPPLSQIPELLEWNGTLSPPFRDARPIWAWRVRVAMAQAVIRDQALWPLFAGVETHWELASLIFHVNTIPTAWREYIPITTTMDEMLFVLIHHVDPPSFSENEFLLERLDTKLMDEESLWTKILQSPNKEGSRTLLRQKIERLYYFLKTLWSSHAVALWCYRQLKKYEPYFSTK